jgi:hypothetical protein
MSESLGPTLHGVVMVPPTARGQSSARAQGSRCGPGPQSPVPARCLAPGRVPVWTRITLGDHGPVAAVGGPAGTISNTDGHPALPGSVYARARREVADGAADWRGDVARAR